MSGRHEEKLVRLGRCPASSSDPPPPKKKDAALFKIHTWCACNYPGDEIERDEHWIEASAITSLPFGPSSTTNL